MPLFIFSSTYYYILYFYMAILEIQLFFGNVIIISVDLLDLFLYRIPCNINKSHNTKLYTDDIRILCYFYF